MTVVPNIFFALQLEYCQRDCSYLREAHCYYATLIGGAVVSLPCLSRSAIALGYRIAELSFASVSLCCSKAIKIAASGFSVVSCLPGLGRDFAAEVGDAIYDSHYLC